MDCIADLHRILRVIEDEFVAGNILQLKILRSRGNCGIAGDLDGALVNRLIERASLVLRFQNHIRILIHILDGVRDIRSRRPLGVERKAFCDRRVEIVGSRITQVLIPAAEGIARAGQRIRRRHLRVSLDGLCRDRHSIHMTIEADREELDIPERENVSDLTRQPAILGISFGGNVVRDIGFGRQRDLLAISAGTGRVRRDRFVCILVAMPNGVRNLLRRPLGVEDLVRVDGRREIELLAGAVRSLIPALEGIALASFVSRFRDRAARDDRLRLVGISVHLIFERHGIFGMRRLDHGRFLHGEPIPLTGIPSDRASDRFRRFQRMRHTGTGGRICRLAAVKLCKLRAAERAGVRRVIVLTTAGLIAASHLLQRTFYQTVDRIIFQCSVLDRSIHTVDLDLAQQRPQFFSARRCGRLRHGMLRLDDLLVVLISGPFVVRGQRRIPIDDPCQFRRRTVLPVMCLAAAALCCALAVQVDELVGAELDLIGRLVGRLPKGQTGVDLHRRSRCQAEFRVVRLFLMRVFVVDAANRHIFPVKRFFDVAVFTARRRICRLVIVAAGAFAPLGVESRACAQLNGVAAHIELGIAVQLPAEERAVLAAAADRHIGRDCEFRLCACVHALRLRSRNPRDLSCRMITAIIG